MRALTDVVAPQPYALHMNRKLFSAAIQNNSLPAGREACGPCQAMLCRIVHGWPGLPLPALTRRERLAGWCSQCAPAVEARGSKRCHCTLLLACPSGCSQAALDQHTACTPPSPLCLPSKPSAHRGAQVLHLGTAQLALRTRLARLHLEGGGERQGGGGIVSQTHCSQLCRLLHTTRMRISTSVDQHATSRPNAAHHKLLLHRAVLHHLPVGRRGRCSGIGGAAEHATASAACLPASQPTTRLRQSSVATPLPTCSTRSLTTGRSSTWEGWGRQGKGVI